MAKSSRFIRVTLVLLAVLGSGLSRAERPANPVSGWMNPKGERQTYKLPADGLIMVQSGDKTYFTTPNARFLLKGQLYDVWNGKFIRTVDDAKAVGDRIQLSNLKIDLDEDLKPFYLGSGRHEVVVFLDPHCPYCHKMLNQMDKLRKDYRFKLVMIPALGDRSAETIRKLRCGTDGNDRNGEVVRRLLNTDYQGLKNVRCDLEPFLKSALMAKILGIQGVPTFIDTDGRVLRGYVDDLKGWLEDGDA